MVLHLAGFPMEVDMRYPVCSLNDLKCAILAVKQAFSLHAMYNILAVESDAEIFDGQATHILTHDPDETNGFLSLTLQNDALSIAA